MLVHFPIAFCALELFFLLRWRFRKDPTYLRFARIVFKLTFLAVPVVMAAGLWDAGGLKGLKGEVKEHALMALGFFVIFIFRTYLWRLGKKADSLAGWILIVSSFLTLVLVAVTAFMGGELVYKYG